MTASALVKLDERHYVDPGEVVAVHRPGTLTIVTLKPAVRGETDLRVLYVDAPLADVLAALGRTS